MSQGIGPIIAGGVDINFKNFEFTTKSFGPSFILAGDQNKFVKIENGSTAASIIVLNDTSLDLPIGSWFWIAKTGTADVEVQRDSGVTFGSPLGDVNFKLAGTADEGAFVMCLKWAANTWYVSGPVQPV